ncbi:hypothetical protein FIV42_16090 [Persicimonas caeni]|uniref:Tetratricopeptide repeat protein n=1 Tax=Persicimonas caeni TaxID=2292766 RepID=A0A4Y6PV49_PERCE|nr:hypothetical protein [Persicimonas caeni]QDG52206.1 hypothetical protein FIV42_16090 [Persicimonas caeni]QED33428.1 hypothetical protein FRD00_16085 [Persicimonas caeni]
MAIQVSARASRALLVTLTSLALLAASSLPAPSAYAQSAKPGIDAAVQALQEGNYGYGLELLDNLRRTSDDPRITYYRGYALEKLGHCAAAKQAYRVAAAAPNRKKLQEYASGALEGFDARCVPTSTRPTRSPADLQEVQPNFANTPLPAPSQPSTMRVGWQVFGWTTIFLGGLVAASVPLKSAIEDSAIDAVEPYFVRRYGCQVDRDGASGPACNEEALIKDPAYQTYEDGIVIAERTNKYLLYGGAGLAAVGVLTLITVEVTEPDTVDIAFNPSADGAGLQAIFRF